MCDFAHRIVYFTQLFFRYLCYSNPQPTHSTEFHANMSIDAIPRKGVPSFGLNI